MTGHLIHIGYPKAGSTLLRQWFAEHSQLAFAAEGIAGCRNVHELARSTGRGDVLYRVTSSESFSLPMADVGELDLDHARMLSTAMRPAQAEICSRLAGLFGAARILIVTRGFRAMILYAYSQYVRTGGTEDLETLLAVAARAIAEQGDYDGLIGLYAEAFGEANVIVLPYELLRDDAERFVGEIERRLGLSHVPAPAMRLNPSLSPSEMRWYPRLTRRMRGLPVPAALRRRLLDRYLRALRADRLARFPHLLQRLRPLAPVTADPIGEEMLDLFRGKTERLRGNPLYAPYRQEYFL